MDIMAILNFLVFVLQLLVLQHIVQRPGATCLALAAAVPSAPAVPQGYTVQRNTDCGYPICDTILQQVENKTITQLASICNTTVACQGFNSNGWLKRCLPRFCPQSTAGMEPGSPCDLYTRLSPPLPPPPPQPVPAVVATFYPPEEREEKAGARAPIVVTADAHSKECILEDPLSGERSVVLRPGDYTDFGGWQVLAIGVLKSNVVVASCNITSAKQTCNNGQQQQQQQQLGNNTTATATDTTTTTVVVLERNFERWGLFVYVSEGSTGEMLRLRKSSGAIDALQQTRFNFTDHQPDYFEQATSDPNDYIGRRIIEDSPFGEASYDTASKFLTPALDVTIIGRPEAYLIFSVGSDGKVRPCNVSQDEPIPQPAAGLGDSLGRGVGNMMTSATSLPGLAPAVLPRPPILFDPANWLSHYPGNGANFSDYKSGLVGGTLRVADVTCYDHAADLGFTLQAFVPQTGSPYVVLIRLIEHHRGTSPGAVSATTNTTYISADYETGVLTKSDAETFFASLFGYHSHWSFVFGQGMRLTLPYSERRQVDMARGALAATATLWHGNFPNYGTGIYWHGSPPAASMTDTSGISDSLPLTSLAFDGALLDWGLFDSAQAKFGAYLDTFIFANGTVDMGHWKDVWADAGVGQYNCTFPDGLSDHGRLLEMYTTFVRTTRNESWMQAHLAPALRIANYLMQSRNEAKAGVPKTSLYYGLIFGPGEHDTCDMQRATPPKMGQRGDFYFSVNYWCTSFCIALFFKRMNVVLLLWLSLLD